MDVKNPWGKKNAEIQNILGFSFKAFLKNLTLSMKSSNQEANGFNDG